MFVETASKFKATVTVFRCDNEEEKVDGKSIMQMMMLAATSGTQLAINAEGDDACDAVKALIELVNSRFEED
jgi:phosphotransferase system HPr (HPr) family protein